MFRTMHRFFKDSSAVAAIVFALSVPMIVASAGMAVDLAQAYNVKSRLGNALDKGALAAGSMTGSEAEIQERVERFMDANYPDLRVGDYLEVSVDIVDGLVNVSGHARVDTVFMTILGKDYIDVYQGTQVRRESAGVEAVLVLDVTGSMAGNNIAALKSASLNFIDIMFDRIDDYTYLKIGIVPFSASVNVGNGLAAGFVNRPATDEYVNPASNIQYSSASSGTTNNWRGCILERSGGADVTDASSPNWEMYRYTRICSNYNANGTCRTWANNNPNRDCTNARIVPLTNSRSVLDSAINGLTAAGSTYGNVGMVWGWRVISPDPPFTEGTAYDDEMWSKTVIMMTDGDNVVNTTYSAYGAGAAGQTQTTLNNKFSQVCAAMKAQGITVYTITFQSGITDATRAIFRQCASAPDKYFNAPSNESLYTAFQTIANQLSQLHITQ
jgi:Flp pilus assembly protein TadG